jgi:tetratricopeptide (TPR) repeat protein
MEYIYTQLNLLKILIPFWFIVPLGLSGIFLAAFATMSKKIWLLLIIFVAYSGTIIVTHVTGTYRSSPALLMLLFSGYPFLWIIKEKKKGGFKYVWAFILIFLLYIIPFVQIKNTFGTTQTDMYNSFGAQEEQNGNYQAAINYLTDGIKLDDKNPYPFLNRAQTYLFVGNYNMAILDYQRVAQINPGMYGAYLGLQLANIGKVRGLTSDQLKTGIQNILNERAKELELYNYYPYQSGLSAGRNGQFQKAIQLLEQTRVKYLDSPFVLTNLAGMYANDNQLGKSEELFLLAISQNYYNLPARYGLAMVYTKSGQREKAIEEYNIIESIIPNYLSTRKNLEILIKQ